MADRLRFAFCGVVLASLIASPSVAAAPASAAAEGGFSENIYLQIDADLRVGDYLTLADLREVGVTSSDLQEADRSAALEAPGSDATTFGRGDWAIEKIWYDKNGRGVVLRSGNSG